LVFTRRILRKLLGPILDYQVAYNAANTRVTSLIKQWLGTVDDAQAELHQKVLALEMRLRQELAQTESRLGAHAAARSQEILGAAGRGRDGLGSRLREALARRAEETHAVREESRAFREESRAAETRLRDDLRQEMLAAHAGLREEHARLARDV